MTPTEFFACVEAELPIGAAAARRVVAALRACYVELESLPMADRGVAVDALIPVFDRRACAAGTPPELIALLHEGLYGYATAAPDPDVVRTATAPAVEELLS